MSDIEAGKEGSAIEFQPDQAVVGTLVPRNRNRWILPAVAIGTLYVGGIAYLFNAGLATSLIGNARDFGDPLLQGTQTMRITTATALDLLTLSGVGYLGWRAINHFRRNR